MFIETNDPYFAFRIVLITVSTLGMACTITEFKYNAKKTRIILSLYFLYVAVSTGILVYFLGQMTFQKIALATISVPGILLLYRLSKDEPARALFNYTTQILFSMYCSPTILLVNSLLWNSVLIDFILLLASYALFILLEYRFLRPRFLRLSAIVKHGWGILSLIPCSLLVLTATITLYPEYFAHSSTGIVLFYLLAAVIVIIYFTIFQNLSIQYHFQLANHNMELLELQVYNLKERITENEAAAETARIERHDARHRFQTIASLVENDDAGAALSYIHASLSQLNELEKTRYCSNPVLNAVLTSYLGQAKSDHIRLETHLAIPDNLTVDATELSIVFANALENAIRACRRLPQDERRIVLKCISKPSLMLEVSNPYAGTVRFSEEHLPVASTRDHGIGSRSIAAFCKKHHALCSFQAEQGWFTVRVVM